MKPASTAAATTHTLSSKSLVGWNLWLCRTHQFQSCPQSAAHHSSSSPWRMSSEPALADSPDSAHCFTLVVQMALANLKIREKRSGCAGIARLALNWLGSAQLRPILSVCSQGWLVQTVLPQAPSCWCQCKCAYLYSKHTLDYLMYRIVWRLEQATLSKAENKSSHIHKSRQKLWQCTREPLWEEKEQWLLALHLANRT